MLTYPTEQMILLRNFLPKNNQRNMDKYSKSFIYALKCPDCGKKSTGLTGRLFRTRFKEHLLSYIQQIQNTKFSLHLLECHHSVGPTDGIMKLVQAFNKETFVNVSEDFCSYEAKYKSNKSNGTSILGRNRIFELTVEGKHDRTTCSRYYHPFSIILSSVSAVRHALRNRHRKL
jgi:hypothetical protein